jgi:ferredoxin--NADP+ reductase
MTASSEPRAVPRPADPPVPGTPVLPDAAMHLHPPTDPFLATVVQTRRCTASNKAAGFVRHVALDISGSRMAGKFLAGQSFGVIPPGVDAKGQPHKLRLYSIASPAAGEDGRGGTIATTVKRLIDEHHDDHRLFLGVASNYLCDLKVGDRVKITGPSGKRFVLPADPSRHDFVFFATGTGIAPFRAMLLDLLAGPNAARSTIRLIMGSPYSTDLLYHDELLALAKAHPNFRYLPTLSRESQHDAKPRMYVQNRLASDADDLAPILASERALLYVCGIAGMELGIFQGLYQHLPTEASRQYLAVDAAASDSSAWDRKMIHKQVRPTRRVFLEVY